MTGDAELDRDRVALLRGVEELPTLPTTLVEVMGIDPESNQAFERLVGLAERDPTFAVRLLRVANSAWSSTRTPILDVQKAIARLGARAVGELVTALAVAEVFVPRSAEQRALWLHSIQVGHITSFLLSLDRARRVPLGYMAGLLHDIGRFIYFRVAPGRLRAVNEHAWGTAQELVAAEAAECGMTHDRVGALAARRWGLPDLLVDVIGNHHRDDLSHLAQPTRRAVEAVRYADELSVMLLRIAQQPRTKASPSDILSRASRHRPPWIRTEAPVARELPKLETLSLRRAAMLGLGS